MRAFNPILAAVGLLVHPAAAMREISAARPWRLAVGLFLAIALSTKLWDLLKLRGLVWPGINGMALPPQVWDDPIFPSVGSALGLALLRAGLLVLEAGIVYLAGRGLGGRGPVSALLATQAFASLPSVVRAVAAPVALQDLSNPSGAETVGLVLIEVGSVLWSLVLGVLGVRASLGLSTSRAAVACLVGLVSGLGLATIAGILLDTLGSIVSWPRLLAATPSGLTLLLVLGLILAGILGIALVDRLHRSSRGAARDPGERT